MKITVAGKEKEVAEGTSIEQLVALEKVEMPEYVTISVNDGFLDKEDRASYLLSEGDNVEFLYFMGGGR